MPSTLVSVEHTLTQNTHDTGLCRPKDTDGLHSVIDKTLAGETGTSSFKKKETKITYVIKPLLHLDTV